LGIVQALFEASMYVFVLEWTPALTEALNQDSIDKTDSKNPPIPHGLFFLLRKQSPNHCQDLLFSL